MEQSEMIRQLAAVGCLAKDATCVHKAYHGEKTDPRDQPKGRTYCQLAFSCDGVLNTLPYLDPRYSHQPDLRHLWADRLKAAGTAAPQTDVEKLEAELRAEQEATAEALRKKEEGKKAADLRAQIDAARKTREAALNP